MSSSAPILVTGAAGQVGGVGRHVVEFLRARDIPVRALVRHDDERAKGLRQLGAEIVVADLTKSEQVVPAMLGCSRVYFGMTVSPTYLEATVVMAAAARESENFELLVNMSQMTVSEMDLTHVTESPQHRLQWLSEQALNWSGVPVTHLRPTVFQENPFFMPWAAESIARSGTLRLPFGNGKTSPVAARDVAEVAAAVLLRPRTYVGQVLELTGPRVTNLHGLAEEYASALGRPVKYVDVPFETWRDELKDKEVPAHALGHLLAMAKLHAANRYDRLTTSVEDILGRPATSMSATVKANQERFATA
jgi:NAD(P)H dehydrogenase (quinone)